MYLQLLAPTCVCVLVLCGCVRVCMALRVCACLRVHAACVHPACAPTAAPAARTRAPQARTQRYEGIIDSLKRLLEAERRRTKQVGV